MNTQTTIFIGTQTYEGFSTSKGIYTATINSKGELSNLHLVATTNNPSYLAKTANFLIVISDDASKGLISYKINNNTLIELSTSTTDNGPCFLNVKNNFITTANYKSGSINLHTINNEGILSELLDTQYHKITTPTKHPRQEKAFAHSCYFEPNSDTIISIDLGANKLIFSKIIQDSTTQKLIAFDELEMPRESGPRHLAFHPTKYIFYVVNELSSTITIVHKTKTNNHYSIITSISTLPQNFDKENTAAHIEISKDAKFLYVSNRGHESIAIYNILENGNLKISEWIAVQGAHPRAFSISPDQGFLVVANRDSNTICSFKRNTQTGSLTFINSIAAPRATCIVF